MNKTDNRTLATDALDTLGSILSGGEQRDAIHIAVEPVVAAYQLAPGQHVGRIPSMNGRYGASPNPVGIVDPYLTKPVNAGENFWLLVYPRKITSLRHVWTHPAFDAVEDIPTADVMVEPADEDPDTSTYLKTNSITWIQQYANGLDVDYEELMGHATAFIEHGSYWSEGGRFEGVQVESEFWKHFEIVTGIEVDEDFGNFFSCSC
jgi:hypothetical protein